MARKRSEPMTEADLAAVWADVAEGYRPEAEAAFEQIEAKHPYVFEEGADPADDCRVLVRVTWARLRDFYAVSVMPLTEIPQGCSSKVLTRGRCQRSGWRVPVVVARSASPRAWWARRR
jgi:hypothetical protein